MAAFCQEASVIREIIIRGNQRVSREAIVAAMRTKVGQPYVQENLDLDKQSLNALGFFQAVDVRATPLEGGAWQVTVDVLEQPEIKEIRVTGNSVVSSEDIVEAITPFMKPGDVFNLNAREAATSAIDKLYTDRGYFLAGIIDFKPLEGSPNTINLEILEAQVGTVSVQGNTRTKDWVMRRLIKTRSGEAFSLPRWRNDIRRLMNTQWFESVRSLTDTQRELGKIDLTADVKEARTGMFNVGLQVDPRNTVAGVLRLQQANLGGTGQSVGLNILQATRGGGLSVDLDYTNPFFDARDTTLHAAVYSRVLYRFAGTLFGGGGISPTEDQQYHERRTGASVGLSRPVNDYLTVGTTARFEGITTPDIKRLDANNNVVPIIQQDGEVGVLTFGGTLNRRDVDIDPSRGDWAQLQLEPGIAHIRETGGSRLGLDTGNYTFFRSTVEYRRYFTDQPPRGLELEAPRRVLALRAKYGAITGDVPFFEQFFVGGTDTVRGYLEDRFWGRQMLLTSAEIRYPVQKALNVIGFVDYGGAWGGFGGVGEEFTQSKKFDLHLGYGVGVAFRTPLGPLRLDLGFDENGKSRTHFMIGTSF
ncbi:MAG TPA: BamA/TamA family outer membrane protein [Fimbriimonas sp.]